MKKNPKRWRPMHLLERASWWWQFYVAFVIGLTCWLLAWASGLRLFAGFGVLAAFFALASLLILFKNWRFVRLVRRAPFSGRRILLRTLRPSQVRAFPFANSIPKMILAAVGVTAVCIAFACYYFENT